MNDMLSEEVIENIVSYFRTEPFTKEQLELLYKMIMTQEINITDIN